MSDKLKAIIDIREERNDDHGAVFQLVKKEFVNEVYSDQKEQYLVERLRESDSFIPELSIVAVINQKIIGCILLTKGAIKMEKTCIEHYS